MKFGSLFAGIGGLDLGLERAGMECAWQVELDDYCTKVLEKHWPSVTKHKDVRDVGKENLEPVDLIAGGFPCQPHSVAGKRRGAADDRNLWPEFIRVVRETKPRYVLAENVPGIISTYLDTVLFDLEGEGYTTWPFAFSACGFDAPHRRERIFVVAYATSQRWETRGNRISSRTNTTERQYNQKDKQNREEQGLGVGKTSIVAYANGTRELQSQGSKPNERGWAGDEGEDVADTESVHAQGQPRGQREGQPGGGSWWTVEPDVGRVAHGIPSRVDRLRGLGNAVVPQVAEWIGERIMEHEASQ